MTRAVTHAGAIRHHGLARALAAAALLALALELLALNAPVAMAQATAPAAATTTAAAAARLERLDAGLAAARRTWRPVLVVFSMQQCPWCRQLEREMARPAIQEKLAAWVLVELDAEKMPDEAQLLQVVGTPALRILTPTGQLAAWHDGYLPAEKLAGWLDANYQQASSKVAALLLEENAPDAAAVEQLVGALGSTDPVLREAAMRRLLPHAKMAAAPVAQAFVRGPLVRRLSAMELLQAWHAPVDGLDPWAPETLTEARLKALETWSRQPLPSSLPATGPAADHAAGDAERLAAAGREVERLEVMESPADALAARERLARLGAALLPLVRERLARASADLPRERLTALRYRLVSTDALALGWPGGLDRLASSEAQVRRAAVQELAARVTGREGPLLLELFSNPDPFVREISLRALKSVGGASADQSALVQLLHDPEPNVRAAVLKQLAEEPVQSLVGEIVQYVAEEKDPDLLVHAVRVLRTSGGERAATCLMELLGSSAWQVRAEAAEALGECVGKLSFTRKADVYAAMVKLLDDPDGFVVSRAVVCLQAADLLAAVEPLAKVAERRPELATEVIKALTSGDKTAKAAEPHLRRFCSHSAAAVRAAGVAALCGLADGRVEKELAAALRDPESQVRIAAAEALLQLMDKRRTAAISKSSSGGSSSSWGLRSVFSSQGGGNASSESEQWLERFRAGRGRPAWMGQMAEPCLPMLEAVAPDERVAAALPLVGLGHDAKALPVLLAAMKADPALAVMVARALPWLPCEKRVELFNTLVAQASDETPLEAIVQAMCQMPDARAAEPVWDTLARETATVETAGAVYTGLRSMYLGERYYDPSSASPARKKAAAAAARRRALEGPDLQRTVALALLSQVAPDQTAEVAQHVLADGKAGEWLRLDAFQVRLLSVPHDQGVPLAVQAMSDPVLRKVALPYLADGTSPLRMLRGHYRLDLGYSMVISAGGYVQGGTPIAVTAPKGLELAMLRPLLADKEPYLAAYAGYLTAVLGDKSAGLDPLISHWRQHGHTDQNWQRLVYRAIAATNDDGQVPVLEEIYRDLKDREYYIKEFYWTIRTMDGPKALTLRKQIRQDMGMERLR